MGRKSVTAWAIYKAHNKAYFAVQLALISEKRGRQSHSLGLVQQFARPISQGLVLARSRGLSLKWENGGQWQDQL